MFGDRTKGDLTAGASLPQLTQSDFGKLAFEDKLAAFKSGQATEVIAAEQRANSLVRSYLDNPVSSGAVQANHLSEAFETLRNINGPKHITTVTAERALGSFHVNEGIERSNPATITRGLDHLKSALATQREYGSPEYTSPTLELMAQGYRVLGDADTANSLLRQASRAQEAWKAPLELAERAGYSAPLTGQLFAEALYVSTPDNLRPRSGHIRIGEASHALVLSDLGDVFHEGWRRIYTEANPGKPRFKTTTDQEWIESNRMALAAGEPWIRAVPNKNGVVEVDIAALENRKLPSDRQLENVASAYVAVKGLTEKMNQQGAVLPQHILEISDVVHAEWLRRNSYVFDSKYDEGGAEDSSTVRLQRLPFSELYERGKTDKVAAAEAAKDIEAVLAAIETINDAFKGSIDGKILGKLALEPLAL